MTPPPSVFIVEDEALIAMELRDRLTRLGYEVRGVAARGERAVEEIPAARPDLVLMDVRLAGKLDGIETARQVHERLDVPVVFLTAFSDPELVRRASAVGPLGYLLKPFEERELHATIQVALVKHRADTERKEMERRLSRAQRLEAVGTLAGGIAHDLNNALTPVTMALDHLRALCPEHADLLDILDAGTTRAVGMVRQLLTFARGSAEGKRVAVPIRPLVMEIDKIVRSTFPKSIRLDVDAPPGLPAVEADPTQLHQVLLNLCVNARDAMPDGGTLTLTARATDLDEAGAAALGEADAKPGRYLVLSAADTGAGIPPDVLDRIFEPFFTTKGPEQGTGLGLFTVLGVTKKHGGFVRVRSQVGAGTEFAVYLPACPPEAAPAPAAPPAPAARGAGELLLVVDDDDGVRSTLRTILTDLGFRVLTAESGAAGLAVATAHRAELAAVVTDLHMPGMSGIALAEELRRLAPALPVVVVSGLLSESDTARLRALGVDSVLGKPFTRDGLLTTVRAALAVPPAG